MEFLTISITLFLIMDPFGNIPLFMSVLERVPDDRKRKVIVRELLLALVVIVGFIFTGKYVMELMGLRQESVSIAGGIILFLIALKMVFPRRDEDPGELEGEPILVPLAIPLVCGPSMLASLLLFSSSETIPTAELLAAAGIAWAASFVVLTSSTFVAGILTKKGLIAMERLMGMLLVALSVQMFLNGLSSFMK